MWMPVDPVARESTLEFVAGSHLGPWLMPRTFMDNEAKWFPAGTLTELPDIDGRPDEFTILGWALEPGDVERCRVHARTNRRGYDLVGGGWVRIAKAAGVRVVAKPVFESGLPGQLERLGHARIGRR